MGIQPADLDLDEDDAPSSSATLSDSGTSCDGSAGAQREALSELLGITPQQCSEMLGQLDAPQCLISPALDAGFVRADADAALAGAQDEAACSALAAEAFRGLRLEASFTAHHPLEGADGCDSLVIKGRAVDVSARLVREDGGAATDAPPLQLGITLVYAAGPEVEDLPNAGLEPLMEVLELAQPAASLQVGARRRGEGRPAGAGAALGGSSARGDWSGCEDVQSTAATMTTAATAAGGPAGAAEATSLAAPPQPSAAAGSALGPSATQRRKRALAVSPRAPTVAPPSRTVRGLATTAGGVAAFRVKVNVLTSMRRGALFRLCVFPADAALCAGGAALCAQTAAMKTLCKPPRALPPAAAHASSAAEARAAPSQPRPDPETANLSERAAQQLAIIDSLRTSNSQLLEELGRMRAASADGDTPAATQAAHGVPVDDAESSASRRAGSRSKARGR